MNRSLLFMPGSPSSGKASEPANQPSQPTSRASQPAEPGGRREEGGGGGSGEQMHGFETGRQAGRHVATGAL